MERERNHSKVGSVEITQFRKLDEVFSLLSQNEQGLNSVTDEKLLCEISFSRDNLDDVIYSLKFLGNKEIYKQIIDSKASCFNRLGEKEKEKALTYANIFYYTLINTPTVYSFSQMGLGEEGIFIAYIYSDQYTPGKKDQNMHIAWKGEKESFKIFDKILEISRKDHADFPLELRSTGNISINSKNDTIYVDFSGNSRKGNFCYPPKLLANFKEDIMSIITYNDSFRGKNVEIYF